MGRKRNAFSGISFEQFIVQHTTEQTNKPVYCMYCGQDIKQPTKNSTKVGEKWYDDWELQYRVHKTCYYQRRGY